MKIRSIYIYGFGKWKDHQIEFKKDSFVVIAGENESGKSTIRQFLLFILFGLSPKKRESYRPKTGGEIGGSVTVWAKEHGEFTIERLHDRKNGEVTCYLSNGTTVGESWLKDYMRGMNRETFESIFSFDTKQLSYLHTLTSTELGDVLLGVGMTGMDKISSIERFLDQEINKRYRPQGKKPKINEQLELLDDLYSQYTKLEEEEISYRDKKDEEKSISKELESLKEKLDIFHKRKTSVEKQLQVNSLLLEAYQLNHQLKQHDNIIHFPENGLERYQSLKEQLLPLKSEREVIKENKKNYQKEVNDYETKLMNDKALQLTEILLEKVSKYEQWKHQYTEQMKQIEMLENELEAEINQLKVGLDWQQLNQYVFPFHLEDTWTFIKQEIVQLKREQERLQHELDALKNEQKTLEDQKQVFEKQLLDDGTFNELKEKVDQFKQAEGIQFLNQWQNEQKHKWRLQKKKQLKASTFILTASVLIAIGLLVYSILANHYTWGLMGLILSILGVTQRLWMSYSSQQMEQYLTNKTANSTPAIDENDRKMSEQLVLEQEGIRNKISSINEQRQKISVQMLKLEERILFIQEKHNQLNEKKHQQIKTYPFLDYVDVDYWPKLFHHISAGLTKLKRRHFLVEQSDKIQQLARAYEDELDNFIKKQFSTYESQEIDVNIKSLKQIVDQQAKNRNHLEQCKSWIEQCDEQHQKITQRMKPYEEEIDKLLEIAEANDEEAYLQIGNKSNEYEQLESKLHAIMLQVQQVLPDFRKEMLKMQPKDSSELEQQLRLIEDEIKRTNKDLDQKRQLLADIKAESNKMENSEDYSVIRHRFSMEREQLKEHAKEWAVYQVAKEILTETKQQYQHKYLPKVMEQTSYNFRLLTNNNYRTVYPPSSDHNSLQVEHETGLRYEVRELSQGTSDQLYIALRLALSEVLSEEYTMPFFIDDAFVHFDDNRRKIMLEILTEIANTKQVILFTCQESIKVQVQHSTETVVEEI